MPKSPDAFRTISEVADWLGIQAHVLRFWESKFTQVKPIKRAGGRRYYRPADMQLLGGIKKLLHDDGLTIKGVQKILREEGMSHVAALSIPLDDTADAPVASKPAPEPEPEPKGVVLPFEADESTKNDVQPSDTETEAPSPTVEQPAAESAETQQAPDAADVAEMQPLPDGTDDAAPQDADPAAPDRVASEEAEPDAPAASKLPSFLHEPLTEDSHAAPTDNAPAEPEAAMPMPAPEPAQTPDVIETAATPADDAAQPAEPAAETPPEAAPKPRVIDLEPFTPEAGFDASPGLLAKVSRARVLGPNEAGKIKPLLTQLAALREQMAQKRRPTSGR